MSVLTQEVSFAAHESCIWDIYRAERCGLQFWFFAFLAFWHWDNISGLRSYHLSSKAKTHIPSRVVVKTKWEKVCKAPFQCLVVYATCSIHDSIIMIEAYLSRDVRYLVKKSNLILWNACHLFHILCLRCSLPLCCRWENEDAVI